MQFQRPQIIIIAVCWIMSLSASANSAKHIVDRGETLESIAVFHDTTIEEIVELNPTASELIYVGMELEIPAKTSSPKIMSASNGKVETPVKSEAFPFLSHSHSRPKSTSKKDSKFLKSYYKLFDKLEASKSNKDVVKSNKKLIDFFYKNLSGRNSDIAKYQIGHYYAFGCFDNHFDGRPSDMDRSNKNPYDKEKASYYLNMVPQLYGLLRLIPDIWMYDIGDAVRLLADNGRINDDDVVEYFNNHPEISINIYNIGRKILDYCDINCGKVNHQSPSAVQDLISMAYNLNDSHPMKQQLMPDLTPDEAAALAYEYTQKGDIYNSLFYSCLAAYKGNPNGVILFANTAIESRHRHCSSINDRAHRETVESGLDMLCSAINLWIFQETFKKDGFSEYCDIIESIRKYCEETQEELYTAFQNRQKQERSQRRRELWGNIGMALLSTAAQVGTSYLASTQSAPSLSSSNAFNLNSLIDPRLAMMQVQNQSMAEYNNFCIYNKKPDGSDYSYQEWYAMKGAAINNANGSGDSSSKLSSSDNNLSMGSAGATKTYKPSCPHCHGLGKCWTCNGDHKYINPLTGNYVECPNCKPDGVCTFCGGSGKKS